MMTKAEINKWYRMAELDKTEFWSSNHMIAVCQTALHYIEENARLKWDKEGAERRLHNEFAMKNISSCFIGCEACERNASNESKTEWNPAIKSNECPTDGSCESCQ